MPSAESAHQMATRVLAKVKPEMLTWARESAGFAIPEAAATLGILEDRLAGWERGEAQPTIPQLRALAGVYKRPLSVLFLQEVPTAFQVLSDFRRPAHGPSRFTPELTQEIRFAHQRRELARELLVDLGDEPPALAQRLELGTNPEAAARTLREVLGISNEALGRFAGDADGRSALKFWREAIEAAGVLVFQATRVAASEASGFALAYADLPVIVVNRKDPPTRRLFSLVHEFAHVLLRQSGVSDLNVDLSRPAEQPAVELFCNAVAAAALMPAELIQADPVATAHGMSSEWADAELVPLSRRYGVSREALIIRLIGLQRTDWAFFMRKRAQYSDEYQQQRERQANAPAQKIARNMPQETLSNFGRPLVSLLMGNYFQDRLTLSEVSGYLGLRTRHVEKLQRMAFAT